MKILIIDDNDSVRSELCDFFEMEDCEVLSAPDGLEGLVLAMKYMPDVVISDIKMPIVDGLQFYKFLKMNPKTAGIPVILFSGNTDEIQKKFALELGIKHYFIKPFNIENIYSTVLNLAG